MVQVRHATTLRRVGALLALLCPIAWLFTGWHLAVEAHHDHAVSAVDDAHDHDHDHHHDDDHHDGGPAPADDEGHHHDDHLIPDSLRPDHGPASSIDLEPSPVARDELAATPAPVATPLDDVSPATDPPIESRRPRAPPVG